VGLAVTVALVAANGPCRLVLREEVAVTRTIPDLHRVHACPGVRGMTEHEVAAK